MFKDKMIFYGTHAQMVSDLDEYVGGNSKYEFIDRNIDTYMIAPLLGVLYGVKEAENKELSIDGTAVPHKTIFDSTMIKHNSELTLIYQLVMLFHDRDMLDIDIRVNRAFKDFANRASTDNHKQNMELFNSYVRGGISLLHEKVTKDATTFKSYITNYNDFIKEFNEEFIEKIDFSHIDINNIK